MPTIPKISRLTRLPELLKHKQESEEKSRQDREKDREEQHDTFDIEDELSLSPESVYELRVTLPAKQPSQPKTHEKGKGEHVDLKA